MSTQKHMGRNALVDRLTAQVGGDRQLALSILRKRGHVKADSEGLTAAGRRRDAMTAEERAKGRAKAATGRPTRDFTYNPATNRTTLKKQKRKGF